VSSAASLSPNDEQEAFDSFVLFGPNADGCSLSIVAPTILAISLQRTLKSTINRPRIFSLKRVIAVFALKLSLIDNFLKYGR